MKHFDCLLNLNLSGRAKQLIATLLGMLTYLHFGNLGIKKALIFSEQFCVFGW
jgi:hypothetical protein